MGGAVQYPLDMNNGRLITPSLMFLLFMSLLFNVQPMRNAPKWIE